MMEIHILFHDVLSHWLFYGIVTILCYVKATTRYCGKSVDFGFEIAANVVYNLYFSPLAKVPGPFLSKISAIPNFYHATTGHRHVWIWQCHQIYGKLCIDMKVMPQLVLMEKR